MSRTHLLVPDQQAHPDFNNDRADWLGKLIKDLKPDVLINIGDAADMPSLGSYAIGTGGSGGPNFTTDFEAHLYSQDLLCAPSNPHASQRDKQPANGRNVFRPEPAVAE